MLAPDWAVKIVEEVCAEHNKTIPTLTVRQSRKNPLTSGSMYRKSNRIVVTFGMAGIDHKQVLLHELAHLVNPKGGDKALGSPIARRFEIARFKNPGLTVINHETSKSRP